MSLDLSWNGFGSNHADVSSQAAFAIANAIRTNTTLTHLDLSHDRLTVPDCQEISEGTSLFPTFHFVLFYHMSI